MVGQLLISSSVALVVLAGVVLVVAGALSRRGGRAATFLGHRTRVIRAAVVVAVVAVVATSVAVFCL